MATVRLHTWFVVLLGLALPLAAFLSWGPVTPRMLGTIVGSGLAMAAVPFAIAAIWRGMQSVKTETPYTVSLLVLAVIALLMLIA